MPSMCTASRTERIPAPSDTTALKSSVSAAAWSIISPPTESPTPPMRSGLTSGRLRGRRSPPPGRVCLSSRGRSGRRRSRPRRAGRRAEPRSSSRTSSLAGFCGPLRPGKEITVAPFLEGTNQPWRRRPSLVVNETFSCGAPSCGSARSARAEWVMTYDSARGNITKGSVTRNASARATRRVAPDDAPALPRPPERRRRCRRAAHRPGSSGAP